ncbi:hypothetical protein BB558_001621 [Smittium angustum]|uniref:Polymerase/histidinol phosphatase N-terminal domain-containing protein n=1 Tax=Smittium angustum TaxID=133377 RepID=A0A2U1JAY7_SMIAN|nr:hypothetical protein BB558_001621 [Smittium angustum]
MSTLEPQKPSYTARSKTLLFEYFKKLGIRILYFIVYLAIFIAILLYLKTKINYEELDYTKIQFPWHSDPKSYLVPYNQTFGDYNILLDTHSHTTYSDGRMSPGKLIEQAISNGYNAIAVTDHQTVEGGLAAMKYVEENYAGKIIVIPGMEYTCCRIHMNFLNINETVPVVSPKPTDNDLKVAINRAHELGGLVIVNHIWWSLTMQEGYNVPKLVDHPTKEQLLEWGVDGFEVVNQNVFDLPTYQFVKNHTSQLVAVAGSDTHYPNNDFSYTIMKTVNFTKEAIMERLKPSATTQENVSFLLEPAGMRNVASAPFTSAYYKYTPLMALSSYFENFYTRMTGTYSFKGTFCQPSKTILHTEMFGWLDILDQIVC